MLYINMHVHIISVGFGSTGGPRLVRILGPGKNRTCEIRTSGYYIANFHSYEFYYSNSTSMNFIPIAPKFVLVEFVLVEIVLGGEPMYTQRNCL